MRNSEIESHLSPLGSSLCLGLEERLCFEERQLERYLIKDIAPNITKRNANPNCLRNSTATGSGFKCTFSSACPYQFEYSIVILTRPGLRFVLFFPIVTTHRVPCPWRLSLRAGNRYLVFNALHSVARGAIRLQHPDGFAHSIGNAL